MTFASSLAVAGLAGALTFAADAHAQQALVADRPDFTEGPSTVGRGGFQIEFGYTFGRDGDGGTTVNSHSLGEPLLRAGLLADWLELRVAAGPVAQRTEMNGFSTSDTGFEDLYLAFKVSLADQKGIVPALAILPQITLPTGSGGFSGDRALPGVNLVYGWDAGDRISLAGSTQVNRMATDSGDGYAAWAQSLAGGLSIGARHGVYAEWYAIFHGEPDIGWEEHYFDTGLTWLLTDDLQWDIRVGFGLNDAAEDLFFGSGLSVRIR